MKLGFIGAGKMAAALARGALDAGLCTADELLASSRSDASRRAFAAAVGVGHEHSLTADSGRVARESEAIFLCVKPADCVSVLREVAPHVGGKLVISIAAGVRLADLETAAGNRTPVIRVMPNTPALVRRGAAAYARGAAATDEHAALVERLFCALGDIHAVPEAWMDAVTGLSGSGPAYVYMVIEALADGGVLMGLPRALAASLAVQTVAGAAEMVRQTGRHPAELRDAVASPGGTTIAGIEALEKMGLRAALLAAVRAAAEKAGGNE